MHRSSLWVPLVWKTKVVVSVDLWTQLVRSFAATLAHTVKSLAFLNLN
jgi:hypothetical protein